MGYGLSVLSANGATQINTDVTGRNIYQFAAGSTAAGGTGNQIVTNAQSGGTWVTEIFNTGVTNTNALFFVRPTSTSGNPICYAYRGSSGTFGLTADGIYTWDWAVFVPATQVGSTPTSGDYGLVVYDSTGNTASSNIVFNGFDAKAMRIKGSITGSGSISTTSGYALQQQKHSGVKRSDSATDGFVRTWCTEFTSSAINHVIARTVFLASSGSNPEPEPSDVFNLPANPTTLIIEV
jgi:hypothetical protein